MKLKRIFCSFSCIHSASSSYWRIEAQLQNSHMLMILKTEACYSRYVYALKNWQLEKQKIDSNIAKNIGIYDSFNWNMHKYQVSLSIEWKNVLTFTFLEFWCFPLLLSLKYGEHIPTQTFQAVQLSFFIAYENEYYSVLSFLRLTHIIHSELIGFTHVS